MEVKIGFLGLLALLFIALKLCGVITWSWLWVIAPLWIPLMIAILVCLGALLVWLGTLFVVGVLKGLAGRKHPGCKRG